MLYTLLSLSPEKQTQVTIHSHHEAKESVRQALEMQVKAYIASQNAVKHYTPLIKDEDRSEDWTVFEDCFYSTIDCDAEDKTIVSVWEKYTRPGKIYGQTPKRRHDKFFLIVTGPLITSAPIVPSPPPCPSPPKQNGSQQAVMSYQSVIDELKIRLEQRRQRSFLTKSLPDQLISAGLTTPPTTPISPSFSPRSPPPFLRTMPHVEFGSPTFEDDESLLKKEWKVYVNPMWQSGAEPNQAMDDDDEDESEVYQKVPKTKKRVHFQDDVAEKDKSTKEEWNFTWPATAFAPWTADDLLACGEEQTDKQVELQEIKKKGVQDFERELDEIIASMVVKQQKQDNVPHNLVPEGANASEWLISYQKVLNEWRDERAASMWNQDVQEGDFSLDESECEGEDDSDSGYEQL